MPKIICWDLENTSLVADFGHELCMGYKEIGKSAHVISIDQFPRFKKDTTDDRDLVKRTCEILFSADMWVTWYGLRYDLPFLQTRMLAHGLGVAPPIPHVDGWRIAKYKMKMHSNRLSSVSDFLDLGEKNSVSGRVWIRAGSGHRPSLRYVIDHCKRDVELLEDVYKIISPLDSDHPNIALMDNPKSSTRRLCNVCGNESLVLYGRRVTAKRVYQRYNCTICGAWVKLPYREEENAHLRR